MTEALKGNIALSLRGGVLRKGGKAILNACDIDARFGEILILFGPNGAGKTSLLRVLAELEPLSEGVLSKAAPPEKRGADLGFAFQKPLFLNQSARRNLLFALRSGGKNAFKGDLEAQADSLLETSGLRAISQTPANALSGGEARKLETLRAICRRPAFIFLDEPTAGADTDATAWIERVILENAQDGACVILSSHDLAQAKRLNARAMTAENGVFKETRKKTNRPATRGE